MLTNADLVSNWERLANVHIPAAARRLLKVLKDVELAPFASASAHQRTAVMTSLVSAPAFGLCAGCAAEKPADARRALRRRLGHRLQAGAAAFGPL